jgi:tellurite resistance protein TerA
MSEQNITQASLIEANRDRSKFSGHGKSLGAAGYKEASDHPENCEFLSEPGTSIAINPGKTGFDTIMMGVTWDNVKTQDSGFFGKLFKKARKIGVDLDIGALYELQDGSRGAIQAFGEKFGALDNAPFIWLSGDERTGDAKGHDEYLMVKGGNWPKIKRLLIYIYIYDGAPRWSEIKPQLMVDVPGENDFYVTLKAHNDALQLCAIAGLENVRGGIKLTNYTEYFPGHMEMDRAFGFGLPWEDGRK